MLSMIIMHTLSRQTDGQTNIMAIARRFVLTNAKTLIQDAFNGNFVVSNAYK